MKPRRSLAVRFIDRKRSLYRLAVSMSHGKGAARRAGNRRLRAAFDNAAVGMVNFGVDGRLLNVNRRLCDILGYSHAELLSKTFQTLTHPDDLESDLALLLQMAACEIDNYSTERRYLRKDGSIVWARLAVGCVRKADRTAIDYFVGVIENVDSRKHAEAALKKSEGRLTAALRAGKLGVYDYDPRSGLIEWDATVRWIWGVPADETVTIETFEAGLHPDDLAPVRAAIERSFDPSGTGHYEAEYRVINRLDKSVRWVFADGDVFFDQDGPYRMVGVVQDITERRCAEAALREKTALLKAITESTPDLVFAKNRESRMLLANAATLNAIGKTAAEVLGTTEAEWHDDPNQAMAIMENDRRIMESGVAETVEEIFTRPGGQTRVYVGTKSPLRDDRGELFGVVGVMRDVTALKRTENALRESEHQFRSLADAIPQLAWVANADGWVVWYNRRWYEYTGTSPEQMEGWGWESLLHPETRPEVLEHWRASLATGEPANIVFPLRGGDGEFRRFLVRAQPVKDADGRVVRWFGTNTDVDELKRAEDALRTSEERYRGIFQNAGIGIAIADLDGRFQSCNPSYERLLGFTLDELRALSVPDVIHSEDRQANMAEIQKLLAQQIPSFEIVNRYVSKSGKPIWVHKHVSLLCGNDGRPASIISLVTDITERIRSEEQIKLLMSEVTHRSKNILSIVQAIAWHTAAASPGDFVKRFGERIRSLAASQDLLVNGAWNAVELRDLVSSQLDHFRDLIGTRIKLKGPPFAVSASAAQALGMAMHELATNAGKYGALSNAAGEIEIRWDIGREANDNQTFAMEWRESGGPAVSASTRQGFGYTVMVRMAESSLNAKVGLDFAESGLVWHLQCQLQNVAA
jgi:PAS domain S-box-containing protein